MRPRLGEGHPSSGDDAVGVPHDEVFGEFCAVNSYIDCHPSELFTI
jgi:hypothetical protein